MMLHRLVLSAAFALIPSAAFAIAAGGVSIGVVANLPAGFYVSTIGSDSNDGLTPTVQGTHGPFATITKCQTAMRTGNKYCYIRSGTYSPASVGTCSVTGADTAGMNISSSDSGETFQYYPPDGYLSAVIDGGNTPGSTNGLAYIVCVGSGNYSVTFNGLAIRHAYKDLFLAQGGMQLTNNEIGYASFDAYPNDHGCVTSIGSAATTIPTLISHNWIHDCYDRGIDIEATGNTAYNNLSIDHNFIQNTAIEAGDSGSIYYGESTFTPATGVTIAYNYSRDVNAVNNIQPGSGNNVGFCWYFDASVTSKTINGNVCTGTIGFANPTGGGGNACWYVHQGNNNLGTGNICSLSNTSMQIATIPQTGPTGNTWTHNIIVANQAQSAGTGYNASSSGQWTVSHNQYYNYNTSFGVNTGGTNGNSDSSPVSGNPLIHCWGAILAATSPAYNSPVSFPVQPSNWDTPGFWGPPGFTVTQTGTAPVWPTSSGDGVTCTGSN